MRISNWSSDVCSSDLEAANALSTPLLDALSEALVRLRDSGAPVIGIRGAGKGFSAGVDLSEYNAAATPTADAARLRRNVERWLDIWRRSEEHTSELQSLMGNSYAVFCLIKEKH